MRKFSWYTIIHPDWNKGEPPLFRLVGPAILPDERTCDIYFKPNRKGGHTQNHFYNVCSRHLRPSKDRRKRMFKDFLEKKTCIDIFNKGVQNPKCRESFTRSIFK